MESSNQQTVELEYNENTAPSHDLHQDVDPRYELTQLASRKLNNDILSIRFDKEGDLLALGLKNGTRILYSLPEHKFIAQTNDFKENAITSMKWRPSREDQKKILVTADAGGHLYFLHVPSLKPVFTVQEHDNSINSVDFTPNAQLFATGGKDCHVRIYDEETKTVTHDFLPSSWNNQGHDNRIFALKFIDDSTLISGGWDSVVHLWDLRASKSVHHFYGPNISGESLDYENGMVLAGCYAAQKQLQFWDLRTLQKVEQIDWTNGNLDDAEYIYTASVNKRCPDMVGAGSTGPNSEVRVLKESSDNSHKHECVMRLSGLSQGCFSLDFSSRKNHFAFSTPHHGLYIYGYERKH